MKILSLFYDENSMGAVVLEITPREGRAEKITLVDATKPTDIYPLAEIGCMAGDCQRIIYPAQMVDGAGRELPNPMKEYLGSGITQSSRMTPLSASVELSQSIKLLETSDFPGWPLLQRGIAALPKASSPVLLALAQGIAYARRRYTLPRPTSRPMTPGRMATWRGLF